MKKVEAIVSSSRLERLRRFLEGLGVSGMTIAEVQAPNGDEQRTELYRAARHRVALRRVVRIEILLEDGLVPMVIEEIVRAFRRGKASDGSIFVLPVAGGPPIRVTSDS